jgi:hypothetical protein
MSPELKAVAEIMRERLGAIYDAEYAGYKSEYLKGKKESILLIMQDIAKTQGTKGEKFLRECLLSNEFAFVR